MRENLERPSNKLLNYFFPGKIIKVRPLVPKIRQIILEQETDMLLFIKLEGRKAFILHWEFQTTNDPRMITRMASYDFMLHLKYNLEIVSIVVYIGNDSMNMDDTLSFNGNHYQCKMVDIRDIDPKLFLQSENPREIILGVLAGRDNKHRKLIVQEILVKLQKLLVKSASELKERLSDLEIMGGLRSQELHKLIIKEEQKMPIVYDIRKDFRFQQGKTEGASETLVATAKRMLQKDFDIQLIHETTSLPIAKILDLKAEINK